MKHHSSNRQAGFQALWLVVTLAVLGVGTWYAVGPGGWFRVSDEPLLVGADVQRGPLRISVIERGNLKAADSVTMKSEIEGSTTILSLIEEGTSVEEGDLLCELDVSDLIDRKFSREISVRNAEAEYVKAKQAWEIQKSQNESDIAAAEQSLTFAREDLRKFVEGERESLLAKGEEAITLATEEFARAEDKLRWSNELEAKGFLTSTEQEADRLAKNRAEIMLEQAKRDFGLLRDFQVPRDKAELEADLAEAKRELERVKLQATARLVDYEAAMNTGKAKLDLESDELDDLLGQINKAKIFAPRAGMVVYAKEPGGRYGREDPIAEGTQVRERQALITIPSALGMIAEVSLHESVLKQVAAGQTCIVRVDAVPGQEFEGQVSFVALLPDQNSWFANPNQRLYRTEVSIGNGSQEMRPGMSCSIEILVDDIDDATYAPVQSIFRHGGGNVAFVSDAGAYDTREVEVGRYNDRWVQIVSGLTEGEVVLLSPPAGFELKPAGEEDSGIRARKVDPHGAPAGTPGHSGDGAGPGNAGPHGAAANATAHPGAEGAPATASGGGAPSAEQIEAWKKKRKAEGGSKSTRGSGGDAPAGGTGAPSSGS
jgi:HlyD family secretion protein